MGPPLGAYELLAASLAFGELARVCFWIRIFCSLYQGEVCGVGEAVRKTFRVKQKRLSVRGEGWQETLGLPMHGHGLGVFFGRDSEFAVTPKWKS